jgi:hypothetical protein
MKKTRIRELNVGEPVADAEAISYMLGGVPTGTLHRWAQEDGWPRRHSTTRNGRRTEYSVPAAKASYERRRDTPPDPPLDMLTSSEVTFGHVGDLSSPDVQLSKDLHQEGPVRPCPQ